MRRVGCYRLVMNEELETDYLVVGGGAAAMAFTDALLAHSDATVTIVDRRHAPGGHWIDAYPYVRLHQPSAFYGVSSVPLGQDALDVAGTNAGYYELAGADEIRAYFAHVMQRRFLPSGRVRYFPSSEYLGEGRFVSRLAQVSRTVRVRRKVVDTTYLEGTIPATSAPPFEVAEGVRCLPAGEITRIAGAPRALRHHRRRQDSPGHLRMAAGTGRARLGDPLDQAARGMVAEPPVPSAARAAPGLLSRHGDPVRGHGTGDVDPGSLCAPRKRGVLPSHRSRRRSDHVPRRGDQRGRAWASAPDRGRCPPGSRAQNRARRDRPGRGPRADERGGRCMSTARREGPCDLLCARSSSPDG